MSSGEGTELPHWADPPTGEVPRALAEQHGPDDEMQAWRLLGSRGLHWRDDVNDWEDGPGVEDLVDDNDQPLTPPPSSRGGPFSFDEDFERLERERLRAARVGRDAPPEVVGLLPAEPAAAGSDEPVTSATPSEVAPAVNPGAQANGSPSSAGTAGGGSGGGARRGPQGHRASRPYDVGEEGAGVDGRGRDVASAVATGAGLAAVFVICYLIGPAALVGLSAVAVLGCALELFAMLQRVGFRPATLVAAPGAAGTVLVAYWKAEPAISVMFVVVVAASLLWYLVRVVDARPVVNVAVTVVGYAWVGVFGSFAGLLLKAPYGKHLFLAAVVTTVVCDVAAWLVGSAFGSHLMAPRTSPGKTWEGFVAGGVAALVAGAIIGKEVTPWGGATHGLELGLMVAIVAPLGDLVQSMVKRDLHLKDSGSLLPGHGGLLDRFDSLLFVLPATYFLVAVLHLA